MSSRSILQGLLRYFHYRTVHRCLIHFIPSSSHPCELCKHDCGMHPVFQGLREGATPGGTRGRNTPVTPIERWQLPWGMATPHSRCAGPLGAAAARNGCGAAPLPPPPPPSPPPLCAVPVPLVSDAAFDACCSATSPIERSGVATTLSCTSVLRVLRALKGPAAVTAVVSASKVVARLQAVILRCLLIFHQRLSLW